MDSKIKRLTILAMLGSMVLVAAVIVVFNYDVLYRPAVQPSRSRRQKTEGALEGRRHGKRR